MTVVIMVGIVIGIGYLFIKEVYYNGPSDQDPTGYITLTPKQAKQKLDNENGIVTLDVRTLKECAGGHLPNRIRIPFDDLETEAQKKLPDKDAPIFVYSDSWVKSKAGSKKLVFLGYTKIFNIGDFNDWPYEISNVN